MPMFLNCTDAATDFARSVLDNPNMSVDARLNAAQIILLREITEQLDSIRNELPAR